MQKPICNTIINNALLKSFSQHHNKNEYRPESFTLNLLTKRLLIALGLPSLLVFFAYIFRDLLLAQQHTLLALVPDFPYFFAAIGILLSLGFKSARDFYILLVLTSAYAGLQYLLWQQPQHWNTSLFITSLYFILPLNLILHNLLKDRGILSSHGLWRLVLTCMQFTIILWFIREPGYHFEPFFNYSPFQWPIQHYTPISFLGLVTLLSGLLLLGFQTFLHQSVLHAGRWAMLFSVLFALHHVQTPWLSSVYFSIAALACLIAIILNSYNLAYLDELTHLPTRRALKQHMMNLGRRYTLALVDIDFFKKINDKHGHDVGDQVLRMVAGQLRKVHGGGKAYRFGGEEFVIVFQNKDAGESLLMLESLREKVANEPFIQRSRLRPKNKPNKPRPRAKVQRINVTISIGVAEKSAHHDTAHDVLKTADKKLYKAKKTGRNKVCA